MTFDLDSGDSQGAPDPGAYQPAGNPGPLLSEPWTQGDTLRLQKLHNGLSELQQQVDEGQLHDWEAEPVRQEILQQRAPLLAKQQSAKAQAMQEQKLAMLDQHATLQAVEQQAAAFRAQSLPQRVAPYTDLLTGKTVHLVEDGKGRVRELDFGKPEDHFSPWAALALGQTGGEGGGAAGEEFDPEHPPSEEDLSRAYEAELRAQSGTGIHSGEYTPPKPAPSGSIGEAFGPEQQPDGEIGDAYGPEQAQEPSGTPTVISGAGMGGGGWKEGAWSPQEVATLRKVQADLKREREGGTASPFGLTQTQLAQFYRLADSMIQQAPPGNPHLQLERQKAVNRMAIDLAQSHMTGSRNLQRQGAASTEHQRQETARQALQEQRDKQIKERQDKTASFYQHHGTEITKELHEWNKKDSLGNFVQDQANRPAYLKDRASMEAESRRRTQEQLDFVHPEQKAARTQAAFQQVTQRIGRNRDGSPNLLGASNEDLAQLDAHLSNPEQIGMKPQIAKALRERVAAILQGRRFTPPKVQQPAPAPSSAPATQAQPYAVPGYGTIYPQTVGE